MSLAEKIERWQHHRFVKDKIRHWKDIADGLYDPEKLGIIEPHISPVIIVAATWDHHRNIPPLNGQKITRAVWLTTSLKDNDGTEIHWVIGPDGLASRVGISLLTYKPRVVIREENSFTDCKPLDGQRFTKAEFNNLPEGVKGGIITQPFPDESGTEFAWCLLFPEPIHARENPVVWRSFLIKDFNLHPAQLVSGSRAPGHQLFQGTMAINAVGQSLPFELAL